MFRRCVSLLVIVGFLASQLAAVPHAHGGTSAEDQREHDATPHCHIGHADHDYGHTHSGHGHSHAHPGQRPEGDTKHSSDNSDERPLSNGLSRADHDADAIFVPAHACTALTTSRTDHAVSVWHLLAAAALPGCVADLRANASSSPRWHPPDEVLDASDSYLTLRNLRI